MRNVTGLALRLPRFLPVRVSLRRKLRSNQAEAPKDNCYDLKSKEVNSVPIKENILIFSGTQRKGVTGSREQNRRSPPVCIVPRYYLLTCVI